MDGITFVPPWPIFQHLSRASWLDAKDRVLMDDYFSVESAKPLSDGKFAQAGFATQVDANIPSWNWRYAVMQCARYASTLLPNAWGLQIFALFAPILGEGLVRSFLHHKSARYLEFFPATEIRKAMVATEKERCERCFRADEAEPANDPSAIFLASAPDLKLTRKRCKSSSYITRGAARSRRQMEPRAPAGAELNKLAATSVDRSVSNSSQLLTPPATSTRGFNGQIISCSIHKYEDGTGISFALSCGSTRSTSRSPAGIRKKRSSTQRYIGHFPRTYVPEENRNA